MIPISAIIISFNEADRIGETISSLSFCDEILVVDAHSIDRTREIALEAGARVLTRKWKGYSDQKNYAAAEASNDWVFSVDADERPSIELADEVRRWKQNGLSAGFAGLSAGFAGLSMPRRAFYLGRWISHSGWYPDRKVRVYDRRAARWEGDFVHEGLSVEGTVGRLHGDLLHFPYRSLDDHARRIDNYTRLAAARAKKAGRHFNPLRLMLSPPLFFLKTFFLQRGFLDGRAGLKIASMGARYAFLKEFRILR